MEKRILIVDDEVMLAEALSFLFEDEGWVTAIAATGKEALSKVDSFNPSVVLSDINMPDMDGLEMLENLYKKNIVTPVILITGYRDTQKMQRAWAACVYDFLDKPIDQSALISVVNNAHSHGKDYVETARKRFEKFKKIA